MSERVTQRLRHLVEGQERERSRWARELHDQTLQNLAIVTMKLRRAAGLSAADEIRTAIDDVLDDLGREVNELRRLITELRPAALNHFGLRVGIEALCDEVAGTGEADGEPTVSKNVADAEGLVGGEELELTIYRVIQESLTNVRRHSGAAHVWVELRRRAGEVEVSVRDDGAGFSPGEESGGYGLAGIRERVALAGGTVRIHSSPGKGTEVRALLPLPETSSESPA
jgi:signal transduction histidine kinase